MSIIPVFLGVLAFALILGNFFLSLIQPSEEEIMKEKGESNKKSFSQSNEELRAEAAISSSTEKQLNERLYHKTLALEAKIGKIDNFRANTEIELKAIKEILMKMEGKGKPSKGKKSKKKPANDLNEKEMHKIIFRSKTN